jgi:hypothetical protein
MKKPCGFIARTVPAVVVAGLVAVEVDCGAGVQLIATTTKTIIKLSIKVIKCLLFKKYLQKYFHKF